MNKDKQSQMILNDNLWKVMWTLSWPAVVAMVLFGLNVIFDAIFVGRYVGETALAGVSIVYPLTQISLGIGSLIGVGAGSLLSIAIGQGDKQTQRKIVGNSNYLVIVSGILMTLLGLIFMTPLLKMMGATGQELAYGVDYFTVVLYGSILWIGGIGYNMIVRAEGKMSTAATMMGIGLLINVVANYILIVVLNMGVKGAAWGTNIGMFIYVLLFFIYCHQNRATFETDEKRVFREKSITKQILGLGFPSLLMTIMAVIQGIVVMQALNWYGTTADVAFYGIVFRLFNLFLTPIYGLMRALQPAIGINFGAKKYERVISSFKIFGVASLLIMLPFWLFAMALPHTVLGIMLPGKSFLANDISNFRIFISVAPILPVVFMAMTLWPAIKKPKPAGVIGIARQALLYIPAMMILPRFFGVSWVYKGAFIIDAFLAIVVVFMVSKEFKLLRKMEI